MKTVRHLEKNENGKDFFIGDLHGALDSLLFMMEVVGFDKTKDRIIACGDLVDRGDNSMGCLDLLLEPWFFSVFGNHEEFCLLGFKDYSHTGAIHMINGGHWFYEMTESNQQYSPKYVINIRKPKCELNKSSTNIAVIFRQS